jgi:hypothetical protein
MRARASTSETQSRRGPALDSRARIGEARGKIGVGSRCRYRASALGVEKFETRRDGGNDVNDPTATFGMGHKKSQMTAVLDQHS